MIKAFPILLILLAQGCASFNAHYGADNEFGHPYSGLENAITHAPCLTLLSGTVLFLPAPFILADIPLSLVADTILFPFDLAAEPAKERAEITKTVSEVCNEIREGMSSESKQTEKSKS